MPKINITDVSSRSCVMKHLIVFAFLICACAGPRTEPDGLAGEARKDSLRLFPAPQYTPGKPGKDSIPLPKTVMVDISACPRVKAGKPKTIRYTRYIKPGVSFLPQNDDDIKNNNPPVKSQLPVAIKAGSPNRIFVKTHSRASQRDTSQRDDTIKKKYYRTNPPTND
ncbi:MAG: hypothetical protein HY738_07185, partial [Bacteroidia bacterium]|nr:hypothetical protein [Bacteroidia bacterium]